jgi:hypothetical protein
MAYYVQTKTPARRSVSSHPTRHGIGGQDAMTEDEQELEALRKVAWCAQARISADEIAHPTMSRAEAVKDADTRLRQQLGKWQMRFCSAKAHTTSSTNGEQ